METHRYEVRQISKRIKSFYEARKPFHVYHGSTNSLRAEDNPKAVVNTSALSNILDVNRQGKYAMVEPNVSMDQLVKETQRFGLIPSVVPAFPGLTVGGVFSGTVAGSSSFKYGFFDRIVTWIEVVLADGRITRASTTRSPELLSGLAGTLGTLGIATLFQIKLITVKPYVNITYIQVKTTQEALDTLERCGQDHANDFVEGFIFGPDSLTFGVIAVGRMSATKEFRKQRFSRRCDPWFYLHALKAGPCTESVPMTDYLFRYDRGSFCMGRYCFGRIPFNKITRWLTDSATRSQKLAQTIRSLNWSQHFIIQDLVVPTGTASLLLGHLEDSLAIYPLRLCPIRTAIPAIMRPNPRRADLHLGIGIRGHTDDSILDSGTFRERIRSIETVVRELGGLKWLYSKSFYTEEEFWTIYPREKYEALRVKCNAQYLLNFHEKTHKNNGRRKKHRPEGFWSHIFDRTSVLAQARKEEQR
jgi:FAD/FMN-containing dehydrogenase